MNETRLFIKNLVPLAKDYIKDFTVSSTQDWTSFGSWVLDAETDPRLRLTETVTGGKVQFICNDYAVGAAYIDANRFDEYPLVSGNTYLVSGFIDNFYNEDSSFYLAYADIILGTAATASNSIRLTDTGYFEALLIADSNNVRIKCESEGAGLISISSLNIKDYIDYGDTEIDLFNEIPYSINYQLDDVSNPSSRMGFYSKTIIIPNTKRNSRIFNHIFEIEGNSRFNPNKKMDIVLQKNNITIFEGILKLEKIFIDDRKDISYEVTLSSNIIDFFSLIADRQLTDLDLSEFNHNLTRDNVVNSWTVSITKNGATYDNFNGTVSGHFPNGSPNGEGYTYYVGANGNQSFVQDANGYPTYFMLKDLKPSIYLKQYIDKIFKSAGYTYESNFFNSVLFKRLVIPPTTTKTLISQTEIDTRKFSAYSLNPTSADTKVECQYYEAVGGSSGNGYQLVRTVPYDVIQFDNSGTYNSTISTWICNKGGTYNFEASTALSWRFEGVKIPLGINNATNYVYPNFYLQYGFLEIVLVKAGVTYDHNNYSTFQVIGQGANFGKNGGSNLLNYTSAIATNTSGVDVDGNDTAIPKVTSNDVSLSVGDSVFVRLIMAIGIRNTTTGNLIWGRASTTDYTTQPQGTGVPTNGLFVAPDCQPIPLFPNYLFALPSWYGHSDGTNGSQTAGGRVYLRINDQYVFKNEVVNLQLAETTPVRMNEMIPTGVKQIDVLQSVFKMFNMFIVPDKNNPRNFFIEPREDILSDEYYDWSEKIDTNQIIIEPLADLDTKNYIFKYKQDVDYYNKSYTEFYKYGYGSRTLELNSDFLKGTSTVELIFSPTIVARPYANQVALPMSITKEEKAIDTNIRVCFFNGIQGDEGRDWYLVWQNGSGGVITYEPRNLISFSMDDDLYNPTNTLCWGANATEYYYTNASGSVNRTITNGDLYNKYYSKYLQELIDKDSRLITAYVKVTPEDIYNISFSKLYYFDGHWTRLYKIEDYNPTSDGLTKCIFIKANRGRAYTGATQTIGTGFGSFLATGMTASLLSLGVVRADLVPTRGGRITSSSDSFIAVDNEQLISGNRINIHPSATQTHVMGNDIFIGANTNRINIVNSDYIYVNSGLQNVSITNTSGTSGRTLNITESNVAYIDGVKYKDGRVQKSAVNPIKIDGGTDTLVDVFSDSVIDKVDGGYDTLRAKTSSSIVNIISGGFNKL